MVVEADGIRLLSLIGLQALRELDQHEFTRATDLSPGEMNATIAALLKSTGNSQARVLHSQLAEALDQGAGEVELPLILRQVHAAAVAGAQAEAFRGRAGPHAEPPTGWRKLPIDAIRGSDELLRLGADRLARHLSGYDPDLQARGDVKSTDCILRSGHAVLPSVVLQAWRPDDPMGSPKRLDDLLAAQRTSAIGAILVSKVALAAPVQGVVVLEYDEQNDEFAEPGLVDLKRELEAGDPEREAVVSRIFIPQGWGARRRRGPLTSSPHPGWTQP